MFVLAVRYTVLRAGTTSYHSLFTVRNFVLFPTQKFRFALDPLKGNTKLSVPVVVDHTTPSWSTSDLKNPGTVTGRTPREQTPPESGPKRLNSLRIWTVVSEYDPEPFPQGEDGESTNREPLCPDYD